jgi:hypothetical protein
VPQCPTHGELGLHCWCVESQHLDVRSRGELQENVVSLEPESTHFHVCVEARVLGDRTPRTCVVCVPRDSASGERVCTDTQDMECRCATRLC